MKHYIKYALMERMKPDERANARIEAAHKIMANRGGGRGRKKIAGDIQTGGVTKK